MRLNSFQRAQGFGTGMPVRGGGSVGGGGASHPSSVADIRRFRVKHALQSIEDALILLDTRPVDGVEIAALERIRDDLEIALRLAESECSH